jgi:hypothetical protein
MVLSNSSEANRSRARRLPEMLLVEVLKVIVSARTWFTYVQLAGRSPAIAYGATT